MMPMVGARVDLSEDEMSENNESEGESATDESDSDIDQALADGLNVDDISNAYMSLEEMPVFNELMDLSSMMQNPPLPYFHRSFP